MLVGREWILIACHRGRLYRIRETTIEQWKTACEARGGLIPRVAQQLTAVTAPSKKDNARQHLHRLRTRNDLKARRLFTRSRRDIPGPKIQDIEVQKPSYTRMAMGGRIRMSWSWW